jgi:phosphatidylserine/phosphatidylglycerophosphate/cardiolipin synthase-like enzyme
MNKYKVYFGGPDQHPRVLRNLLQKKIEAVPAGGEIFWITYYFRDLSLADALCKSKQKGVQTRVLLEAKPRMKTANIPVIRELQQKNNLSNDCKAIVHAGYWKLIRRKRTNIHEKIYYFSHPVPHVLVGSFNPSGNQPEDPEIIKEIGDQYRGHNYLVEIAEPTVVSGLKEHMQEMYASRHNLWGQFFSKSLKNLTYEDLSIYFFPECGAAVVYRLLQSLPKNTQLRIAISHLTLVPMVSTLIDLARQGIQITLITHDTLRRFPEKIERMLSSAPIYFYRYQHPQKLPMHNKFMLINSPEQKIVAFGSLNFTKRSFFANHEILLVSRSPFLYQAFEQRWGHILNEITQNQYCLCE